jgi:ubiquinone/menaquinone biosynthesis C-methylase UbiE
MSSILLRIKITIKESGLLPSYKVREKLAALHLRGEGIEIGALHLPLKTPLNVKVKYVDIATREENIGRFPEVDSSRIVHTDYLEDGFEIKSIPDSSQDFVIANHVLEHSDNPFKVLLNWSRVLKPGGIMMITVPIAARCFDRNRQETTLEHLVDDYRLAVAGEQEVLRQRNRDHYEEWLRTSAPIVARMRGNVEKEPSGTNGSEWLEDLQSADNGDIHFHTFSMESFASFADCFASRIAGNFRVVDLRSSRGGSEVIAIMKKL